MNKNAKKQEYRTPSLTVHGSLESLTQANGARNALDANFPDGTPFGQLTFS